LRVSGARPSPSALTRPWNDLGTAYRWHHREHHRENHPEHHPELLRCCASGIWTAHPGTMAVEVVCVWGGDGDPDRMPELCLALSFRFVCFPCCYSATQAPSSREAGTPSASRPARSCCLPTAGAKRHSGQESHSSEIWDWGSRLSVSPSVSPQPSSIWTPFWSCPPSAPSRSRSSPGRSEVPVSVPLLQHCSFPSAHPGYVTRHSMALPMICPSLSVWRRQSMISQLSIEHTKMQESKKSREAICRQSACKRTK